VTPRFSLELVPLIHHLQHRLQQAGCIARLRDAHRLEVWEAHLSEHYLVSIDVQHDPPIDIVQLVT
jgi:hypothetical protein